MAEQFPKAVLFYSENRCSERVEGDEGIKEIISKKIPIQDIYVDGECTRRESYQLSPLFLHGNPKNCETYDGKPEDPQFCAFCKHWKGLTKLDIFRLIVLFTHPEVLEQRLSASKALTAAVMDRFNDLDVMDYD